MKGQIKGYDKFKLVIMAAHRAKELARGAPPFIDVGVGKKVASIALEEIKQNAVDVNKIEKKVMRSLQSYEAQRSLFENRAGRVEDEVYDLFLESLDIKRDSEIDSAGISVSTAEEQKEQSQEKNIYEDVVFAQE